LNTRHLPDDLNFDSTARASVFLIAALLVVSVLLGITAVQPWRQAVAPLLGFAVVIVLFLLLLNRRVYAFFLRKRGWWFVIRAVLAHWMYYLYGGVTFLVVAIDHYLHGYRRHPKPTPNTASPENRESL
jgi:hypothetical protein